MSAPSLTEPSPQELKELFLIICKHLKTIEETQAELINLLTKISCVDEAPKNKPLSYTT
jgi:hypothetical protein